MAETKTTFCRICEAACGLKVTVERNRVLDIQPDRDHPVSKGYACAKGLKFGPLHHSPDRLMFPLKRVGDGFERIGWDQALGEIGAKVRRLRAAHGPDSIAMYLGNPSGFSTLHAAFGQGFLTGVGSRNMFSAGSQDCNNKFLVSQYMYGFPFTLTFPDLEHTACLIVLGSNPAVSKMSFISAPRPVEQLRRIVARGGRVVSFNPRRVETARVVGEHHFIRPDTDVYLLLAFLRELLATGGADEARVGRFTKGFDDLRRVAEPWTPERAAAVTGVAADTLRDVVAAYRQAPGAALYGSTGINQGTNGTLAFWILEAINAVSGNLDRRGGTLVGRGLVDLPAYGKKVGFALRTDRSRVGGLASVVDTFPGGILPDEILTPGRGQIRALIVSAGNPLLSFPNANRLRAALQQLELLVSIDIFRNETGSLAHYVLPAVSFLQRADLPGFLSAFTGQTPTPYVQYTDTVVEPEGEQRDDWWIFSELAHACGVNLFGSRVAQGVFDVDRLLRRLPLVGSRLGFTAERAIALFLLASRETTIGALRRQPSGILRAPHRPGDFLGARVVTDDGLVDLAPAAFVARARELDRAYERELADRDRLKLITKRETLTHNSWMHNVESFVGPGTNYVYMHPLDARRTAVMDGDRVEVRSRTATIVLPMCETEELMPGTVAVPHGWGHGDADGLRVARGAAGANVNALAADGPDALEPLSGMAQLTGILVDVRKAATPGAECA
jgi:anaerobic selenocysteine-containing dehydrogenase